MNEMSNKLKIFLMLARLTVIVSIIGCVYQIADITIEYFEKETVTFIKINTPSKLTIPAVSFCTRLPNLVDFEKLSSLQPNFTKHLQDMYPFVNSSKTYSDLIKNANGYGMMLIRLTNTLSLKEIGQVLLSWSQLMARVDLIQHEKFGYLNHSLVNDYCDVKLFAMQLDACYRFECIKRGNYDVTRSDLMRSLFKEDIVTFLIDQDMFTNIQHLNLYLHSPNTMPRGQSSPTIIIKSAKEATLQYVTYKRYASNRLPAPYESDCRRYSREGFQSRHHALELCENNYSLKLLNAPFYGNTHTFDLNATHGYKFYDRNYTNPIIQNIFNRIQAKCHGKYTQPDCREEFFIPKLLSPRKWKANHTQIIIRWPSEPDTIVYQKDRLPFSEYIIFVESVFGTWFGFCFAGSLPELYRWALRTPKVKYRKISLKLTKPGRQKFNMQVY